MNIFGCPRCRRLQSSRRLATRPPAMPRRHSPTRTGRIHGPPRVHQHRGVWTIRKPHRSTGDHTAFV